MICHGFWDGPWGWALIALLIVLVFFASVVGIIVSLVRSRPGAPTPAGSHAVRMLEERYARGEIPRDEFLERRRVLTGP